MNQHENSGPNTDGTGHFDRYVETLGPLFDPSQLRGVERLFQFVCCVIRAGGMEDQGWDPIVESTDLIDDLSRLSTEPVDPQKYPHPDKTRARLVVRHVSIFGHGHGINSAQSLTNHSTAHPNV